MSSEYDQSVIGVSSNCNRSVIKVSSEWYKSVIVVSSESRGSVIDVFSLQYIAIPDISKHLKGLHDYLNNRIPIVIHELEA